jgi:hypothetical protein
VVCVLLEVAIKVLDGAAHVHSRHLAMLVPSRADAAQLGHDSDTRSVPGENGPAGHARSRASSQGGRLHRRRSRTRGVRSRSTRGSCGSRCPCSRRRRWLVPCTCLTRRVSAYPRYGRCAAPTDGRHVAEDLRAVDADPVERRVREDVAAPGRPRQYMSPRTYEPPHMLFLKHKSVYARGHKQGQTHQLSFCVKKYFMPASRISCGSAPVRPNESGSQPVSQRCPNLGASRL